MLKSLYVSSFVIIDKIQIDFYSGMNVMTGETGSGKSIIIDALGQLCGNRASASYVKKGAAKAIIEGVFEINMSDSFKKICDELHIEPDDEYVVTKEIQNNGKSQVKINYQLASNSALKILMPYLIDIHSQFETQRLFEYQNHIHLLDTYAKKDIQKPLKDYQSLYAQYKQAHLALDKAMHEDFSDEQLDFLVSQIQEIDALPYSDEEIEELENELRILENYEKMNETMQQFEKLMNHSQGVLPQLKEAVYQFQSLAKNVQFQEIYEQFNNLYYTLVDEYETAFDIYREFQFDEYRFNELQDILWKVNRAKRKYGFTMTAIHEYRDELQKKVEAIENREHYIQNLKREQDMLEKEAFKQAESLNQIRLRYAQQFEKNIQKELQDLYLDQAIFKVQIKPSVLSSYGNSDICFMVSLNQGQDLSLLNESASGGELSRIMLAIKTVILAYNSIETIVFDEVDSGISGKVATSIGEKIKNLASKKQVLCITHLPQVAALAHHHYCIEKKNDDHQTVSSIRLLNSQERIMEIAKMLSGEKITKEAIDNAKKLIHE